MVTIRKYTQQDAQATWELYFNTIRNINSKRPANYTGSSFTFHGKSESISSG